VVLFLSEDISEVRSKNKLRRLFLLLAYLRARNYGKSIMSLLLSRGKISESSAASLTGLSLLNSRAVISSLLSSGLLHIAGEKQLRMKNRRRYVEIIFSVDEVAAQRVLRELLSNILSLMKSVFEHIEIDQIVYYCERDISLFSEPEVGPNEYRCPICGEPLEPIWVNIDKLSEYIEKIKEEFKSIISL